MEQKDIFQHIKEIKPENRLNTHLKNKLDIEKVALQDRCPFKRFKSRDFLSQDKKIMTF
jgi:hypothetical protein